MDFSSESEDELPKLNVSTMSTPKVNLSTTKPDTNKTVIEVESSSDESGVKKTTADYTMESEPSEVRVVRTSDMRKGQHNSDSYRQVFFFSR